MTLRDQLDAATPAERVLLRAQAHGALASFKGRSWSRGAFTVTVIDGPTFVMVGESPAIRLSLQIARNGKDVTPADFNPWLIVNPPLAVDPGGPIDPEGALIAIVRDKLRQLAG